jgi:hypothetical protein
MKWCRTLVLFSAGGVVSSEDWRTVHESYVRSIQSIDYPAGSGTLTLKKKKQLPNGQWQRNGVTFLRKQFLNHIVGVEGWHPEGNVKVVGKPPPPITLYPSMGKHNEPVTSEFGGFDLVTTAPGGSRIAIEWETGNISSSHRSMNKLAIALESGVIEAGVLIVPSRALYEHLTDRIGNIGELSGYLRMWQSLGQSVQKGLLAVTVVEHDALTDSEDAPYLVVGKDGRAAEGRAKGP